MLKNDIEVNSKQKILNASKIYNFDLLNHVNIK